MSDNKREKRSFITSMSEGSEGSVSIEVVGIDDAINFNFDTATFPQEFLTKLATIGIKTKVAGALSGIKDANDIVDVANKVIADLQDFRLAPERIKRTTYSQATQDLITAYAISMGVDTHDSEAVLNAENYVVSLNKKQATALRKQPLVVVQLNNLQNARILASFNS